MNTILLTLLISLVQPGQGDTTVHKLWEFKSAKYLRPGSYGMDKIKVLNLKNKSLIHIEIEGEKKPQTGKYKIVDNFIIILDENEKPLTDADFDIRIGELTEHDLTLVLVAHFVTGENKVEGDLVEIRFREKLN